MGPLFEWWTDLPPIFRILVALLTGGLGLAMIFWMHNPRGGVILTGLGFAMVIFGGPSDSKKKGYKF